MTRVSPRIGRVLLLTLSLIPILIPGGPRTALAVDTLGRSEGPGSPAPLFWTGDGQRLNNTSFENGNLQPWIQLATNVASGSGIAVTGPGYDGGRSAHLTLNSGNLSSDSAASLLADLSEEQIGLGGSIRLRAAVRVEVLTGFGLMDRVEVSATLTTSIGQVRRIHYVFAGGGNQIPLNVTTDAYYRVQGFGSLGQWLTLDRDVRADAMARFPAEFSSINSVSEVRLTVYARSTALLFVDANNNSVWGTGESIVYDVNSNSTYDVRDTVITGTPLIGFVLKDDPRIKYVDANNNNDWNTGEVVVYDTNANNRYDTGELIPPGTAPAVGTPLLREARRFSEALFDRVELYSATAGYDWVLNGGFETGSLTGWGYNASFTASTVVRHSGTYSARGTVTNGAIEMAQSIDARPYIGSWARFQASAYITAMTGTSPNDRVVVWLGLVDGEGTPAFIHYVFTTGDGRVPDNTTDTVYFGVEGFGNLNQWLSLDRSLQEEAAFFNSRGYVPPYRIELVVVELSAAGSSISTSAYFDDFSIRGPPNTGLASSYYYALDNINSTHVYTAARIPHGNFTVEIPQGQAVLNITSPEGIALTPSEYTSRVQTGIRRIEVPSSTILRHAPLGDWLIYATSTNAVYAVFAEDPSTGNRSSFGPGAIANLFVEGRDPLGNPLVGASATFTLWTPTSINIGTWSGTTDGQGMLRVNGITMPSTLGVYRLQAMVASNSYVGLRTSSIFIRTQLAVTLSLSTDRTTPGSPVIITSDVNPITEGVNLTISYRQSGSSQWLVLSIGITNSGGRYSYTWKPPEGNHELVARVADSRFAAQESQIRTLIVTRVELALTLNISTDRTAAGSTVLVSGGVTPLSEGVNVTLSYRQAGSSDWVLLATVKTDTSGKFSYSWKPPEGDYELVASVGDSQFLPVQSQRGVLFVTPAEFPTGLLLGLMGVGASVTVAAAVLVRRRRKK